MIRYSATRFMVIILYWHSRVPYRCAHCDRLPGLRTLFDPLLPPLIEALSVAIVVAAIVVAAIVVVHVAVATQGQREAQREAVSTGTDAGVAGAGMGLLASSCVWS